MLLRIRIIRKKSIFGVFKKNVAYILACVQKQKLLKCGREKQSLI